MNYCVREIKSQKVHEQKVRNTPKQKELLKVIQYLFRINLNILQKLK